MGAGGEVGRCLCTSDLTVRTKKEMDRNVAVVFCLGKDGFKRCNNKSY